MTIAVSKYVSTAPCMRKPSGNRFGAVVAIALYPYAAPTPIPISVNMFGLALTNDCHMRSKNGAPHQRTTGVARTRLIQLMEAAGIERLTAPPDSMSLIDSRNTGAPRAAPIQK